MHSSLRQRLNAVHILKAEHSVKTLCRVLGINRSTYYRHSNTSSSPRSNSSFNA
uniref:helix-turn-helix domain-containing protein n=1 Tax=Enterocloster clostridioformis TaxID=1531 RepID=UPI003FA49A0E